MDSAIRERVNPWAYLREVLDRLVGRAAGADVNELLPDVRVTHDAGTADAWRVRR